MSNIIQIKRSSSTAVPANTDLLEGELGYSYESTSNSLFIGVADSGPVVRIGGGKYPWLHQANTGTPGALTANAVIITNGNSFVTSIKTNELSLGTDDGALSANLIAVSGNSTTIGTAANNELASSYAVKTFVDAKTASIAGAIANTQVVYSNEGVLAGSANMTFDNASGLLTVTGSANVSVNIQAGSMNTAGFAANATLVVAPTITTATAATNTAITTSAVAVSNATHNTQITVAGLTTTGLISAGGNANVAGTLGVVGAVAFSNTLSVADSISGASANITNGVAAGSVTVTNATNTGSLAVTNDATVGGNTTVTGSVNAAAINISGAAYIGGNLTVEGTLTTIDSETLTISDPMIKVANGNSTTDVVDIGFYGMFGNTTVTQYTGLVRDQTDGVFKLFTGEIPEPATTVDTANVNFALASLAINGLTATSANITSISSSNVAITGGSISGITDLSVADGGTGVSTFTTNGILFGNGASALQVTAAGTEGQVLQAGAGGVPAFGTLDGGTF